MVNKAHKALFGIKNGSHLSPVSLIKSTFCLIGVSFMTPEHAKLFRCAITQVKPYYQPQQPTVWLCPGSAPMIYLVEVVQQIRILHFMAIIFQEYIPYVSMCCLQELAVLASCSLWANFVRDPTLHHIYSVALDPWPGVKCPYLANIGQLLITHS